MSLLSENIKRLRKARNLSIDDVAKKTGLSRATITNILYCKHKPSKETIRRIANVFGVSEEQIMNEEVILEGLSIGEKIKVLYKKHHMTQKELAEKAGIFQNTISNIVRGKQIPQMLTLKRIARAFEMTVEEMLDYKEES